MSAPDRVDLAGWLGSADRWTRREFMRRAALIGLSVPALIQMNAAPTAQPSNPNRGQPRRGGTFTTLSHQNIASLSPEDIGSQVLQVLIANIHEGLLAIDANYALQPVLARDFAVSADGRTWTFNLRSGVRWHDGRPFTAADVKYTYDWIRTPANGALTQPVFEEVVAVDAPDDSTVIVTLARPSAPFAALTATTLIVPRHVHEAIGERAYKQQPVGTGPYRLKDLRPTEYCVLAANDDYWGGRPWIDEWRQNVVPEVAVRSIALQTGQADSSTWPLTPEDQLQLIQSPSFRTYRAPGVALNHFVVNNQRPLLTDRRIRQAMLHGIDRDALVNYLMQGFAVKATANLSPAIERYYTAEVQQYPYDIDRARSLLQDAGWRTGAGGVAQNERGERLQLECLVLVGDTLRQTEAQIVQAQLAAVGIELRLRELEPTTALAATQTGDFDLALLNWTYGGVGGDPDARLTLGSGGLGNLSHWNNPDADRLLAAGAAEIDTEKRRVIYAQLQQLVAEEVPFLYIMFWNTVLFFHTRIKGMPDSVSNPYRLFAEFRNYWIDDTN